MSYIQFRDVGKRYDTEAGEESDIFAVKGLSFSVERGEIVSVVGKTGCGKSTMFNLLSGIIAPTEGQVSVDGRDPFREFMSFRGSMSVVFQNDRLMPWRRAIDNVALGLELSGKSHRARTEIAERWLELMGLSNYHDAYPHELSGGMRQRVSIARAFSVDPEILLCDEPFSALDEITARHLRHEFLKLVQERSITSLFVTHSIDEAIGVGHRIMVFDRPARVIANFPVPSKIDDTAKSGLHRRITQLLGEAETGASSDRESESARESEIQAPQM